MAAVCLASCLCVIGLVVASFNVLIVNQFLRVSFHYFYSKIVMLVSTPLTLLFIHNTAFIGSSVLGWGIPLIMNPLINRFGMKIFHCRGHFCCPVSNLRAQPLPTSSASLADCGAELSSDS